MDTFSDGSENKAVVLKMKREKALYLVHPVIKRAVKTQIDMMPKVLAQNINPCNCRLVRLQVCNARNRGMCFLCFLVLSLLAVSNYWYLLLLLQIAILFSKNKLLFSVACCCYFYHSSYYHL